MLNNDQVTIAGCGHIGKLLAQQLRKKNISVSGHVSSDISLAECKNKNIRCEKIDLDQPLKNIDLAAQHLIYLAPPPSMGKKDTRITNYLRAIEQQPPKKFVLISTMVFMAIAKAPGSMKKHH